jgi:ATPase family associated with various cellular activities (AAA)
MSTEQPEGFANNWDYLKTELRWLDQVLMMAVTRQRKESHDVERVSQSRADRVTSHWWKGLVSLEGEAAYDEHRQPQSSAKASYQQQLESRIQSSHRRGIALALPSLRDRLGLSMFEKNVVLMSLAPEMNRRYARLYRYLQGEDAAHKTDLPTVDLVLRLLCRNDSEWRAARTRLTIASPLVRHGLLHLSDSVDTFLNRPLQLTESLIHYLLAEQPTKQSLELLMRAARQIPQGLPAAHSPLLDQTVEPVDWSKLVLPEPVLTSLHYLVQRVDGYSQAEENWGFDGANASVYQPGAIALWVGTPGTGKTLAARAIAHDLEIPLYTVDLAQVELSDYWRLLEEIQTQDPTVLLVKSARHWLGRSTSLPVAALHQFLAQRRSLPGITILNEHRAASIQTSWQRQMDQVLEFPEPGQGDRRQIWQQSFCLSVPRSPDIDWDRLAAVKLNGGEIAAIAHEAVLYTAAIDASRVTMGHIEQVLSQKGKTLPPKPLPKPDQVRATQTQRVQTQKKSAKAAETKKTESKTAQTKKSQTKKSSAKPDAP